MEADMDSSTWPFRHTIRSYERLSSIHDIIRGGKRCPPSRVERIYHLIVELASVSNRLMATTYKCASHLPISIPIS